MPALKMAAALMTAALATTGTVALSPGTASAADCDDFETPIWLKTYNKAPIRKGPAKHWEVVAWVRAGTRLASDGACINSSGNKWFRIYYPHTGWIYSGSVYQI
ncbi:hypothetical protein [Spirillospora sp. CA-128828]|uniref:hypothetical protein n=1 Tax=Spirillospora sp. CA-128828 TaxID=3240033 RepID=UPI003D94B55A